MLPCWGGRKVTIVRWGPATRATSKVKGSVRVELESGGPPGELAVGSSDESERVGRARRRWWWPSRERVTRTRPGWASSGPATGENAKSADDGEGRVRRVQCRRPGPATSVRVKSSDPRFSCHSVLVGGADLTWPGDVTIETRAESSVELVWQGVIAACTRLAPSGEATPSDDRGLPRPAPSGEDAGVEGSTSM